MDSGPALWRLDLALPAVAVPVFEVILEPLFDTVSTFVATAGGTWRLQALSETEPNRAVLEAALADACGLAGLAPVTAVLEPMVARNWVTENLEAFRPFRVGRYFVHGSHHRGGVPTGAIPLRVDASQAFGTGQHATTWGCLTALHRLARRPADRFLDMGCGSGILALAMARTWRRPVVAVDIDPVAVAIARDNARCNGVGGLVRTAVADGYRHALVREGAPYDVITANILARPLRRMAGELVRHLAPGGFCVLSGFMSWDAARVTAPHRGRGLRPVARIDREGWTTLVLRRALHPTA